MAQSAMVSVAVCGRFERWEVSFQRWREWLYYSSPQVLNKLFGTVVEAYKQFCSGNKN